MSDLNKLSRTDMLTDSERSARYHMTRARFCGGAHRWSMVLILFVSGGAAAQIHPYLGVEEQPWLLPGIAFLVALFDVLFDISGRARLHEGLYAEFTRLAGDLYAASDDADMNLYRQRIHELYAKEPPLYRAVEAYCDNQMRVLLDRGWEHYVHLRWYHLWLMNILPFTSADFRSRGQREEIEKGRTKAL